MQLLNECSVIFHPNLTINCHDLFYIYSKRFFLNLKGLCDGKVVLLIKKEYGSTVQFFIDLHKIFKANIWCMIYCNLLKSSFV